MLSYAKSAEPGRERVRRLREAALPHLNGAYCFARFLMGNETDAEDAVRICFVLALRHFDGLHGADIKPWLFQILCNVCRTEYQLRQDDPLQTLGTEPAEVTKPRSLQRPMTPERLAIQDQEAAVLRRLILALPVQLREALVLREYNGLTYQEIAKVTGAPAGTVMSRLSLARENISAARKNAAGPLASGSSKELVFGPR